MTDDIITFQKRQNPVIIKVIGVGGGGSNAVNHMFKQGIKDVDFAVCNTDVQALSVSPVPTKLEIGKKNGLGAGSNPNVGEAAAIASINEIEELLNDETTEMLFITAGMGGGTGTGAAPVIAELAKKKGLLTVGIVTQPFNFEGYKRKQQANIGIEKLNEHVDALLVINNEKLLELDGNLKLAQGFSLADNILANAAKGIAELITVVGFINVDFEDVKAVLKGSGKAIMGTATASGDDRATKAVIEAMNSPLLNDNDIKGATDILLNITTSSNNDLSISEIDTITNHVQKESGEVGKANLIFGTGVDDRLEDGHVNITIIATGFDKPDTPPVDKKPTKIVIGKVGDEAKTSVSPSKTNSTIVPNAHAIPSKEASKPDSIELKKTNENNPSSALGENKITHNLGDTKPNPSIENAAHTTTKQEPVLPLDKNPDNDEHLTSNTHSSLPEMKKDEQFDKEKHTKLTNDRNKTLKQLSLNLKTKKKNEFDATPAYLKKGIVIDVDAPSTKSHVAQYILGEDSKDNATLGANNSFLFDNVD